MTAVHGPHLVTLEDIVGYCDGNNVTAVAIDAQLTMALADENGYRTSDLRLKKELSKDCQNWVISFNGLMAVPVRGRLLADHLSPTVGTLIETHPRASLLFHEVPGKTGRGPFYVVAPNAAPEMHGAV